MTKRKSNTKRGSNPTTKPEENGTGRVTCLISWVYEDDGDGNTSFGDITRSYFSVAALDKQEQESIKKWLKPYYDAGMIMDVYVGPDGNKIDNFLEAMVEIGQCLPELE